MNQNRKGKKRERWTAAGLAMVLLVSLLLPVRAFAAGGEEAVIHIQSQEDLQALAEDCRLDTWSQGKTVILDQDLVLDENAQDFLPIPTFGGTFEGGGHTITGFSLAGEDANAGLFGTLQESAVVSRLRVVGQVLAGEDSTTVGGIVGTNYGKITDCSFEGAVKGGASVGGLVGVNETTGQIIGGQFQGTVTGSHSVGGIAGENSGSLVQCTNRGEINTSVVEVSVNVTDLSALGTTESVPAGTDIGGIAGYSSGVIQDCTNAGNVGYEHMGYNVGGIAGRQSGSLNGCRNTADVRGRKDVGGIAGQLEPQIILHYSRDSLDQIWTELDALQHLTSQAAANAQNSSSSLYSSINGISSNITAAKEAVSGLGSALTDWDKGGDGDLAASAAAAANRINQQTNALNTALSQIMAGADSMNSNLNAASDALLGDVRAINSQLGVITDLLQQSVEETKNQDAADAFQDLSDAASSEPGTGKMCSSVNSGSVEGDVNVGGIAGALSVEYDFDPEQDLVQDGTSSLDFQYRTLALVTGCTNEGTVSARKDNAGGIVGRMDLGAVKACESYGAVESTGGENAGGIAGLCRAVIRNCFVKCGLSGKDYTGGIAGINKDQAVVSGCYSMVEIGGSGCSGAVCSTETGTFSENYYVSDTLAGLGRISYTGKAQPISFEELCQVEGLPDGMTRFTLRFVVDGEEIKSYDFDYGDSFGPEAFPEIPVKDGYYASWDTQDLSNLHFDKTVTAAYARYVLTLPSQASRPSGRPVFLMDGSFDDHATLTAVQAAEPAWMMDKTPVEQWHLSCSDPSQESYKVRYLAPDETAEGYSVYVQDGEGWKKADCTTFGSCLIFDVPGPEADVAVVHTTNGWFKWAVVGAVLLLLVLAGVMQGTIRAKRYSVRALPQSTAEAHPAPKSRRKYWLAAVILVAAAAAAAVWALAGGKLRAAAKACQLLEDFAAQPESAMTLSVDVQLDDLLTSTEMNITRTQAEGQPVTCIQDEGISLYYAGGAVMMENGKAYKITDLHPNYALLPQQAAELFRTVSVSSSRSGGNTIYQLTAEGENARDLLKVFLPDQAENLPDTQQLTVALTAAGSRIVSLQFASEGTLMDNEKTAYSLTAEFMPREMEEAFAIPDAVRQTLASGTVEGQEALSEDVFRLLSAWTSMSREESFTADVALGVDCGPLVWKETMKYGQILVEGNRISCVRKDDAAVYFAGETFCDQNGTVLTSRDTRLVDRARFLEVLKQVCMNGSFSCTETGKDTWLYTLQLDADAMKNVAYAAAPEMESMPVTLSAGSLQLTVSGDAIKEIDCACTGGLNGLDAAAPVTVSAKLDFTHNRVWEVPGAVQEQLTQEGRTEHGQ